MSKVGRFQVGVFAVVEHPTADKVLLVKRSEQKDFLPGVWETPGGRIDQFESPEEALSREIQEETGLDVEIIKAFNVFHIFRGERVPENETIGIEYLCRAKSDQVTLSPEHSEYRWVGCDQLIDFVENEGVKASIEAYIRDGKTQSSFS